VSVEHSPPATGTVSMDSLPFPDYGEYFARRRRLFPQDDDVDVVIPFESGRGCWWGVKHHCTFCGLNGTSMAWRAKSAPRVLEELTEQASRHQIRSFAAVDNIMDPRYLTELLPALSDSAAGFELFYEVKANLSREQLQALARGGVRYLQPGIESLSSAVLRLMDKGVRSSQNVNLLRWAQHFGIETAWNLLWGFPGETAEDYLAQSEVVPHLVHLRPPDSAGRVWLERFSPMFTDAERFPMRFCRPEASYRYVYPAEVDLDKAAYFFEYAFVEALPDSAYEPLRTAVARWCQAWAASTPPRLTYRPTSAGMEVEDTRRPGAERTISLSGEQAQIYLAISDRPTTATAVRNVLGLSQSPDWLEGLFSAWSADGLIFRDEDRVVALALPESSTS
jgi:ribosomal peptide maturation radical SAM protein 1